MARIAILDLHPTVLEESLHKLNPEQINTLIGGIYLPYSNHIPNNIISQLPNFNGKSSTFIYELAPKQLTTTFGGTDLYLTNVPDKEAISQLSNLPNSVNFDNNKFLAVDFSRLTMNFIIAS
jgi:hypothetical protein